MDEDTLDAASSAEISDNEIARIEEESGSSEIILSSSEKAKEGFKDSKGKSLSLRKAYPIVLVDTLQ